MINVRLVDVLFPYNNLNAPAGNKQAVSQNTKSLIDNKYVYKRRQIPLFIDDSLIVIMEFDDIFEKLNNSCKACERNNNKNNKDYETFLNKYNSLILNKKQLDLKSTQTNLIKEVSQLVNCIGCRTSTERFYKLLIKEGINMAMYPFMIDSANGGDVCLNESIANDPMAIYSLFYLNCFLLEDLIEQISKCKKTNRRCQLHSLDYINKPFQQQQQQQLFKLQLATQSLDQFVSAATVAAAAAAAAAAAEQQILTATDTPGSSMSQSSLINSDWRVVWDSFQNEQLRQNAIIIDTSKLLNTLDSYLKKHKFCNDCKLKVIKAYNLLVGDSDPVKEKDYCSSLYDGIKCCTITNPIKNCNYKPAISTTASAAAAATNNISKTVNKLKSAKANLNQSKHLHLINDKNFISNLISKAEPELLGNRRERHAKTIEIAQEEVLTCIGIYLYDRFHLIYQTMKLEEQTWLLLSYASLHALRKCLELEFEKNQGISNLELICAELEALDELEQERKRIKKEKKRNRQRKLKTTLTTTTTQQQSKQQQEEEDCEEDIELEIEEDDLEEIEEESGDVCPINNCAECQSNNSTTNKQDLNNNSNHNKENDGLFNTFLMSLSLTSSTTSSSSSTTSSCNHHHHHHHHHHHNSTSHDDNNKMIELAAGQSLLINHHANDDDNSLLLITDEEKNEYYANKSTYLIERINRRELLKQRFQNLKLNANFKIRPRNVS